MNILKINLHNGRSIEERLTDPLVGGRLLTAQIVNELVDPRADPLGPDNILVFAGGPLAGLRVSTAGRLSVGAKSPLTGGIKEANSGGLAGDSLATLGYRSVVINGTRPGGSPALVMIDRKGAQVLDAGEYWGLRNEALIEKLQEDFGKGYVIISIGTGGEHHVKAASVAVTDKHGKPFRFASRGGLGAVMGSKGLKAVLIERSEEDRSKIDNPAFKQASIAYHKVVATSNRILELRKYGTASTVAPVNYLGGLSVRNFSQGTLPDAENLGGEYMRDCILERGGVGSPTEVCMKGCVIQCSNVFPDENGNLATAPLEFETLGLCGSNLGISSLDDVARLNRLCNDIGLDTIEIGAALGVIMEACESGKVHPPFDQVDLPSFGDMSKAISLVDEVEKGSTIGKLLGDGVVSVGQAIGASHIPAVKGQAMSAYDPRVIKGTGVTYATSPQGADHTAGLTFFAPVNHLDPSIAVKTSRASQLQRAAYDALGLCVFNLGATGQRPDLILDMLRAQYDVELIDGWLDELGGKVIELEIAFNRAAGFTKEDDRIPGYFESETLPPTNTVFDVPQPEMDAIWEKS